MSDFERMASLFEGFRSAYGTHGETEKSVSKGGKLEIKKTARTVREPVSLELWQQHLAGEQPLGVIPINEEGMCVWGCIDVDRYDLNHSEVVQNLRRKKLPLLLCRSKSGGAHAFLFLTEAAPAEEMRAVLKQLAASMGWGDCEIYPKQTQIKSDRGDLGNWLNMPYFGGDKTTRFCVRENGTAYSLTQFLRYAEQSKIVLDDVPLPDSEDEILRDGPPCLQHLCEVGFPEGTRNNGLFALGVFCKKKYGENWEDKLEQCNLNYMRPPLSTEEVQLVIKSLRRKDYNYTCKEPPLVSHCNSSLCRLRKFGVGGKGAFPVISGMSKLSAGEDTIWFVDIDGYDARLELSTSDLMNYRDFQRICMQELTVMFLPMKTGDWMQTVGEAMANATVIEPEPEMTAEGHFRELLEAFCTNRSRGEKREDLLMGRPWLDEEQGRIYFQLSSLMTFLERAGFKRWGRNKVGSVVKKMGGHHFFNLGGKGVNTVWVKDDFQPVPDYPLPELRKDPI